MSVKTCPKDQCDLSRRGWMVALAAAAVLPLTAHAHTPYKQWAVYRQKHLLVGCHKDEPETYALSKQIVSQLESQLPAARARVARAPAASRLASLLATDQLNIAVLTPDIATAMASAKGVFKAYGKISLTTLLPLENHLVVAHSRLQDHHCWQITRALESMTSLDVENASPVLPWHNGSEQYVIGQPMPNNR